MNIIKEGLLNISKGFSYSINIELDINNVEKIKNYIPTDYTINLFENILKKSYGANIMVGSYGTGKSHFTTVLSSILINKFNKTDYKELLEKIGITNKNLKLEIENKLENKSKKLLVLPQDNIKDIKSSILIGLKEALEEEGLEDIIPQTSFDSIKNKILDWKENYHTTYEDFIKTLENEYKIDSNDFINKLNKYDEKIFITFEEIYPKLTAGSTFSPMHNINIVNLLKNVNRRIKENGFEGFVIVFDEFGKYMEQNIKSINLKDIQDIAEYTNDEKENSNLILITHRDLSQYVNIEDKEAIFEWRKVEGRFTKNIFQSDEYQMFDLIGRVLIKNKEKWNAFVSNKDNLSKINQINDDILSIELFEDMPRNIQSNLIDKLYPLHPTSAYSLINLSDKLAQNERTTFTFLCSDEAGTLTDYIESNESDFPIINTDIIYDFYEDLMKKESKDGEVYLNWRNSRGALNLINKNDTVKESILKSLAIINIISKEDILKANDSNIRVLANLDKESYKNNMQELIKDKVLIYRKSIDRYDFYQGSYIDIEKKLDEMPNEEYDFLELLENEFSLIPILPRKHNDDKKINRILECKYINNETINETINEDIYYKEVSDGKMLYFIPSNKDEIEKAKEWAKQQVESVRTIIGIPNTYFEIIGKLNRYEKLKTLIEDEVFLSQDNLLKEEINLYLEDARSEIYTEIDKFTGDRYEFLDIYYRGQKLNANNQLNKLQLNNKISNIFDELYSSTLIINNEMINKNNISPTMKRVVKNVLKLYWETCNILEIERFTEFSAEGTLIRTVLENSKILNCDNNEIKALKNINRFLEETSLNERSFEDLYKSLKDNPYGVKDGLMPILLAISIKNYQKQIYIYRRGKSEDITADIFMEIVKKPSFYTIYTEEWQRDKQIYIEKLEKYLEQHVDKEKKKLNRLQALYEGLKIKYISLSRFARATDMLTQKAIKTRDILENEYIDLRKFFFDVLTSDGKLDYQTAYINLKEMFKEMELFEANIKIQLNSFIKELFSENKVENKDSLKYILNKWKTNNSKAVKILYSDDNINKFINIVENIPEKEEVDYIAESILGVDLNYFDDKFYNEFKEILKNIQETISLEEELDEENLYSINIISPEENYEKNIKDNTISKKGAILEKKLESDIRNFGRSINDEELISILANLIKRY